MTDHLAGTPADFTRVPCIMFDDHVVPPLKKPYNTVTLSLAE